MAFFGATYGGVSWNSFINANNFSSGCRMDGVRTDCNRFRSAVENGLINPESIRLSTTGGFADFFNSGWGGLAMPAISKRWVSDPTKHAGPPRLGRYQIRTPTPESRIGRDRETLGHWGYSANFLLGSPFGPDPQDTFTTNNPAVIDNNGTGQDCGISVSFTGNSVNGMKNGANYYLGNPGLGFTVSISGLRAGGIARLGENKLDPKGGWVLQQLMNVYGWNVREGDTGPPQPGYLATFSDKVDPASIIRHDNQSGGWIDHPGPNLKNEAGKRLTSSYTKWNFLIKAHNGKKECRLAFHAEMTYANGVFTANWGPGLY